MELPPISGEQQKIIDLVTSGCNVICDSVAGSGRTTSNLYLALSQPQSKFLLLTYNSKLKIETRNKAKLLKLTNIAIHSYHAFCVKYYDYNTRTDIHIKKILKNNIEKKKQFAFDKIILDEAQDINQLYFELVSLNQFHSFLKNYHLSYLYF